MFETILSSVYVPKLPFNAHNKARNTLCESIKIDLISRQFSQFNLVELLSQQKQQREFHNT